MRERRLFEIENTPSARPDIRVGSAVRKSSHHEVVEPLATMFRTPAKALAKFQVAGLMRQLGFGDSGFNGYCRRYIRVPPS